MPDPEFLLLGDALWLDFVNTAVTPPGPQDLIPDAAAYHRWTKALKLASDGDRGRLPEILRVRDRLLALARALDAERQPPASAIQTINRILAGTEGSEQLVRVNGAWRTHFRARRPPAALDAIVASAAATLADPLARVRRCAGEDCLLYFCDQSPAQSRTWCSFARCGRRMRLERRRGGRIVPVV